MRYTKFGAGCPYYPPVAPANRPRSTAESSLLEISELQTQLAANLATQNAHIDNLVMDSLATTDNIERGNKELRKASEKASVARSAFFGTVVFCSVVFIWDWFI